MVEPTDNIDPEIQTLLDVCAELKRGLSHLSYVGMGITDELDTELKSLRLLIKNQDDIQDIKVVIDNINKILRTLDDSDSETLTHAEQRLDLLGQLLKSRQLPNDLKSQLKQIQEKPKSDDASTIIIAIADVIQCYITKVEHQQSAEKKPKEIKKKKGFFASLFSKKEKLVAIKEESQTHDKSKTDYSFVSGNVSLPQKVRDSLKLLIEQLSRMDGYSEIANTLHQKIENLNKLEHLSSILEMITGAFIEISDKEHVQFEKFLKTLNTRITRVNDFINRTLQYSQETNKDSNQLNLDLNNNFSEMKDKLSSSQSLEDTKTAVFGHMDSIINQINQFTLKQKDNSEALISQMDKLSEQLRATEDEASRLKDDLAEQRVRAQTDPLTSLPNRYSYGERLTQEYNRWRRYRNPLTLVIGDIDLFKNVNDQQGHIFGDKVLKEVAMFLASGIRESDFIARYGGEEFVILMPETAIVDATRAMNKIRSGLSKLEISNGETTVPVTMSFGLSEFEKDDTTKAVFERADTALYRAKEKGRNLVCCQRAK